jgi:large repetitive protein
VKPLRATIDPASAANGSVSIVNGQIVFAPTLNFNGQASFSYTVSDGVGGTSQATVNLSFNAINDAPVANSELVFGKRNIGYTLTQAALLANDTDVEAPGNLRISSISNVQHDTATLNPDGSVRFIPTAGYAGRGSFDYAVRGGGGGQSNSSGMQLFPQNSPQVSNCHRLWLLG